MASKTIPKLRNVTHECNDTFREVLDLLDSHWRLHVEDGFYLVRVSRQTSLGDQVA